MFRINPSLKENVKRKSEEHNCTMTSYIEFLINKDLEENPIKEKKYVSTGKIRKFLLKRRLD